MRVITRQSGTGFPPLVYGFFGLLSVLFLAAALLTSTRIVLLGRDVEATIVELRRPGRYTDVIVAYQTEDGEEVRSSRGGFNGNELFDLAVALGRHEEGRDHVSGLIGAKVTVRYVPARPTMAAIKAWVPLYREFVAGHCFWIACAGMAAFAYRYRQRS